MFVQRAYVHKAITLSYPVGGGMIRNKKLCRLLEERGQEVGSLLALLGGLLLGDFLLRGLLGDLLLGGGLLDNLLGGFLGCSYNVGQ